jgi:cytochrome P450
MAIHEWLSSGTWSYPGTAVCIFPLLVTFAAIFYRLSPLHPLSRVPGPLIARLTNLEVLYHSYIGDEATYIHKLHEKYGPTVLLTPNSVDFTDFAALHPIYSQKGGFAKAKYYRNFDVDGHASIFSHTDPALRAARAKVVLPLFSPASIRIGRQCFTDSTRRFISLFKLRKESGKVNVLDLARGMSLDAVTEYLFSVRYGALLDQTETEKIASVTRSDEPTMSASAIVDSFSASSRFLYLPCWLYRWADRIDNVIFPNPSLAVSAKIVNAYANRVLDAAESNIEQATDKSNYPSRLLMAGFSRSETIAQCKDIIYAATDTIGMNLSTLIFMLAKHPQAYKMLYAEVMSATITKDEDLQQLPFLNGVIRESLRLSLTNPSRLPREVPAEGWQFQGTSYPAGTIVSASVMDIHFAETLIESPYEFKPERWANASEEMHKSMMAFGLGGRQCIARTMAMYDLHLAVFELVKADLLRGSSPSSNRIMIKEGFSAKVIGGSIDIVWK